MKLQTFKNPSHFIFVTCWNPIGNLVILDFFGVEIWLLENLKKAHIFSQLAKCSQGKKNPSLGML
jgi:hypothetical protein